MDVLKVCNLRRVVGDNVVLTSVSFELSRGEVLFIRGPSGVGKSLLLRAVAGLDQSQDGTTQFNSKSPFEWGFPAWRAHISYLSQSRISFKGTPAEFYFQAQQFASQRGRPRGDLPALVHALGLEQVVLNQQWQELSGGQAQRVALAITVALGPAVILLDEPTSACDLASAMRVEKVLVECGAALLWVSHDPDQPGRVGGRVLDLPLSTLSHVVRAPVPGHLTHAGGLGDAAV